MKTRAAVAFEAGKPLEVVDVVFTLYAKVILLTRYGSTVRSSDNVGERFLVDYFEHAGGFSSACDCEQTFAGPGEVCVEVLFE